MNVRDFLMGYVDRPFVWGQDDCSLLLADWWRANHGTDPAAHLRGTYSTEGEKQRIVDSAGNLCHLVTSIAANAGAVRTKSPVNGDFGVVFVDGSILAGIKIDNFWAIRSPSGIAFTVAARTIRMWSI